MKIKTQYVGPTDTTGSKIRAYCALGEKSLPFAYELSREERHKQAYAALVEKLESAHGSGLTWEHVMG